MNSISVSISSSRISKTACTLVGSLSTILRPPSIHYTCHVIFEHPGANPPLASIKLYPHLTSNGCNDPVFNTGGLCSDSEQQAPPALETTDNLHLTGP